MSQRPQTYFLALTQQRVGWKKGRLGLFAQSRARPSARRHTLETRASVFGRPTSSQGYEGSQPTGSSTGREESKAETGMCVQAQGEGHAPGKPKTTSC